MAFPPERATARRERDALGPGPDLPIARIVALLVIVLPIVVWFVVSGQTAAAPSGQVRDSASFNPRTIFSDSTPHFLPTPVAALPPEANAGPPAPAADEQTAAAVPTERVKVAYTGGAGAILRGDPPGGRQVTGLRDGTVLQVIGHRKLEDGSEWLQVRTPEGVEGWVFSRLVAASE